MPRLSSWFIRASLVYLAAGFTIGALMLANKGLGFDPRLWSWLPVHTEVLLVGWLVQLALGVAFWILPRHPLGAPRGDERLAWLVFGLLNLGIGLVVAATFLTTPSLILTGRAAEIGGILAFIAGAWGRVRPFGG